MGSRVDGLSCRLWPAPPVSPDTWCRFMAEFKAQVVERLLEGGQGLLEVATELGLRTGQLSTWRVEHFAAGAAATLAVKRQRNWIRPGSSVR